MTKLTIIDLEQAKMQHEFAENILSACHLHKASQTETDSARDGAILAKIYVLIAELQQAVLELQGGTK